ncbi:hypothetical protein BN1708_019725, partial [Verticillium longisporum]
GGRHPGPDRTPQ